LTPQKRVNSEKPHQKIRFTNIKIPTPPQKKGAEKRCMLSDQTLDIKVAAEIQRIKNLQPQIESPTEPECST